MIESGELPNIVDELCSAIRHEAKFDTAKKGINVAAAALTDTALSSVIAESDVTSVSIVGSMIAGGVAGGASRTLTAPLERLALLMQVQKLHLTSQGCGLGSTLPAYRGVLHGLRTMYAEGGLRSFFWGNGINILRLVPQRGISFSLFEQWKEYLSQEYWLENMPTPPSTSTSTSSSLSTSSLSPLYLAFGGALSTAIAGALCYPIDVVRTRVTVQRGSSPRSATQIIRSIGSLRELYQGFTPTMIKNVPEWGINFAFFEMLRLKFVPSKFEGGEGEGEGSGSAGGGGGLLNNRTLRLLACGAVTSVVSQSIVYPLETLRRNMQVSMWSSNKFALSGSSLAPTMYNTAKSIYTKRGWRGFYSGLVPTYLRVVPATASGFAIYHAMLEGLKL